MAGIGDYEEGKPFVLKSGNKTSFKGMGSSPLNQVDEFGHSILKHGNQPSPLEWHKEGHDKGFFQSIHGAVQDIKSGQKIGTSEGKKFKDTKFGQKLGEVKEQVTENIQSNEPLLTDVFGKNDKDINIEPGEQESGGEGEGEGSTYEVQRGDNLSKIARNNNMTLAELLEKNPDYKKNPNMVRSGASINL